MVTKVVRSDWTLENGVVVLYGESGAASEGIAVPLQAILALAMHARRFLAGAQMKADREPNHGAWHYAHHMTAQSYDVGVLQPRLAKKFL